jgi:predicted helicase
MSQILINEYLAELESLKRVTGSSRETVIREAFKDLLKRWGRQEKLVFAAELPLETPLKTRISVDGALLLELRMALGYWEAKDIDDDIDAEIAKKFKKGYPQDNIIFSNDAVCVLWQNRQEVLRCDVTDTKALEKLLKLFFSFERAEIADFRRAVEQFKTDLPAVLQALREMIDKEEKANAKFRAAAAKFLTHAQEAINPTLTDADVREMLIQHILTEEIFAKVFDESEFHQHNNVARELYALESAFFTGALKKQTLKGLESYYAAIRAAAAQIGSHGEKQTFLKVIYENFYKVYNAKAADRLGVVYTPNEIVRFMIEGADWLCQTHFGKNLVDKDVDILDPATGTGTFICELLEHFRGDKKKLEHKYKHELHANEVAILPYYVANLNIESTYAAITGKYDEFPNLCFVDTLDNVGLHTAAKGQTTDLFAGVSEENVARIKRQNSKRISVVIGNPPYNANQANENDNNKNREYPEIDKRIKQTYIAESTAQKTKLYDMYARFFRWASDRLHENGVLALVTNRSFIESRTFDGFRKIVGQEFSDIYVVDLGGDVRANPKLSGTKHNVFGIQTGVAVSFMVKRTSGRKSPPPNLPPLGGGTENQQGLSAIDESKTLSGSLPQRGRVGVGERLARIYYARRPEMETAEEKISFLARSPMRNLRFDEISPDKTHNWLNLTSNDFETLIPIASKETKAAKTPAKERAIFKLYTLGVSTNRDEWVYDFSQTQLLKRMRYFIETFDEEKTAKTFRNRIKWSRNLKRRATSGQFEALNESKVRLSNYRPFTSVYFYNSKLYVDERGSVDELFLTDSSQKCFGTIGDATEKPFSILGTHTVTDLNFLSPAAAGTKLFPLWRFDTNCGWIDNITDWALKQFTAHYKSESVDNATEAPSPQPSPRERGGKSKITKEAIFHYCYAVLHDPIYREKYALNLKREFPRIPFYANFWQWAAWGETLMGLHIGYEAVAPFALKRIDITDEKARAAGQAPKAMLRADANAGTITLDSETSLTGVPPEAWTYKLGNRCALEWILDQYKEKKPKDPTIRAKFDTYRFADYKEKVVDLLMRVTTVSVETVAITEAMKRAAR